MKDFGCPIRCTKCITPAIPAMIENGGGGWRGVSHDPWSHNHAVIPGLPGAAQDRGPFWFSHILNEIGPNIDIWNEFKV